MLHQMFNEMYIEKKEVPKGSTILEEKPFVYTLCSKFRTLRCDFCFKREELLKCSNCRYVYYCNRSCQKMGWAIHKLECKFLKGIMPKILPDAARTLARLIKILEKGGNFTKSYYNKRDFRTFKDLMSHYSEIKNDQTKMEHLTSLYSVLEEYFNGEVIPNFVEIMCMYGRMCVNTFSICTQDLQAVGSGIYLAASIVDHSCQPNAIVTFHGTMLVMRSLENIPSMDWSKIYISYLDVMALKEERQKELQATYYFLCKCPKCLEPEPLSEMLGSACPNPNCDNCIDINDIKPNHQCSKCNTTIDEDFINKYHDVMDMTQMHLDNMKDITYLDVCKVCLKAHENVLYKYNVKHVKILDLAFDSSVEFGKFDEAAKYGLQLVESFHKYYGKFHPVTGLLHLKLGKLLCLEEPSNALIHLKSAREILQITHGDCSPLFQEHLVPLLQQTIMMINN